MLETINLAHSPDLVWGGEGETSQNVTASADQFIESVGICNCQPAVLACKRIEDGHKRHIVQQTLKDLSRLRKMYSN